jgi:hypothetical protein
MSERRIGRTIAESTPHWPAPVAPPRGAPNILVVLFDDVGFSDFGCFTGTLHRVTVTIDGAQTLDGDGIGRAEMARQ